MRSSTAKLTEIFGDYRTRLPACQAELTILVSPHAFPIDWSLSSVTANFLASYFKSFFPVLDEHNPELTSQAEAEASISYIANELVENAMKFHHDKRVEMAINIKMYQDNLVFVAKNSVDPSTLGKFYGFIKELTSADPGELYIRHLEEGLESLENTTSGIGFLTIMADYHASIGWKFDIIDATPNIVTVTTMVQLPVVKESTCNGD